MKDPLAPAELVAFSPRIPWVDSAIDFEDPPEDQRPEGYVLSRDRSMRYIRSLDAKHLKFRDGKAPTIFVADPMPVAFVVSVLEGLAGEPGEQAFRAFMASVRAVRLPSGEVLTPPTGSRPGKHGETVAPPEWATIVRDKVGSKAMTAAGELAYRHSSLSEDDRHPFGSSGG